MPRVQRVAKCRKDQGQCGKCGEKLPRGSAYIWWAFRYGGTYKRCIDRMCSPNRADLTQSEILGTLYSMQDSATFEGDTPEEFADCVMEFSENVTADLVDLLQEKLDAIEEGMGHANAPVYEELEERREGFETWAGEIESASEEIRDMSICECEKDGCECETWGDNQLQAAIDLAQDAVGASPE